MADVVLDASAILAFIRAEAGGEQVGRAIRRGLVCTVNLAEVVSVLINGGAVVEEAVSQTDLLSLNLAALDHALAVRTGTLRAVTAHLGLSLGDRACLALAERERLPVLTADRAWRDLDIGVEIRLIR